MNRLIFGLVVLIPSIVFGDQLTVNPSPTPPAYVDSSNVYLYEANTINGWFGVGSYAGSLDGGVTNFQIYCVDIAHDINWGATYGVTGGYLTNLSTLYGPIVAGAQDNVAAVMEAAFNSNVFLNDAASGINDSPSSLYDWNAAVQVALWNAEYNGLTSWSSPNLTISGLYPNATAWAQDILTQAATYLPGSAGLKDGYAHTYLYTAVPGAYPNDPYGTTGQSMVTWDLTGNPNVLVPEPSTFALALLGGIGVLAYRRRRKIDATE